MTTGTSDARPFTVSHVESLAGLEQEWRSLGERSDNVFASWEWLATWWDHFGRDRPLRLVTCRGGDGTLVAILPLYLATGRPARVLRFVGHGPSDQLGPVCTPGDRRVAARAVADVLEDRDDWDLWIGDDVPADVDWVATTGGRRLARQASPVVDLDATWDDWFARQSRNLRQEVRAKTRRLEREGPVRYRRTTDPDRLGDDLDTLIALHDDRWRARGGSRGFRGREAFHRAFAALALERGWLRLHFLEVGGRAVAALYNLRFGDAESYYQGGRSPELAAYSVGTLLHMHALHEAVDDGVREYRFLRGVEPYKLRFADRDFGLESVARTNGVRGRATLAGVARMARYPRWARLRVPAGLAWGTGATPIWGPP